MKTAFVGMDLGGSNLYSIAFDENLQSVLEDKISTNANEGYASVMQRISAQIEKIQKKLITDEYTIGGIGFGVPGVVDSKEGYVSVAPNLNWEDVRPIADLSIDSELKEKCFLINDVNAGLLGEIQTTQKTDGIAVAYFCGTGIGGAIAINGKIHSGSDGSAGEVGHMVVKKGGRMCGCGREGCLEAYIGKYALNRKILKQFDKGKKTKLSDIIDYNLKKLPVKSSSLKKAYEKGDSFTVELMEKYYCSYLAAGISQSSNLLAPDMVILGGGIMESLGAQLIPFIDAAVREGCMGRPPELVLSQTGDLAGPAGAAAFAIQQTGVN